MVRLAAAVAIELAAVGIASIHSGGATSRGDCHAVSSRSTPSSLNYLRSRRRHPKKNRLRPLRRLMNRLSSQLKSQLLPHGRRKPHPRSRDRKSRRIKARATAGSANYSIGQGQLDKCAAALLTLTKRGAPSRPAAANSSSHFDDSGNATDVTAEPEHREPDSRSDFDQHVHALAL